VKASHNVADNISPSRISYAETPVAAGSALGLGIARFGIILLRASVIAVLAAPVVLITVLLLR